MTYRRKLQLVSASAALGMALATPAWADWSATAQTQAYAVDQTLGDVDNVAYSCSAPGSFCTAPTPNGFAVTYASDQFSGKANASSFSTGVYNISYLGETRLTAHAQAESDLSKGSVAINYGETFGSATDYAAANTSAVIYDTAIFSSGGIKPFDVGVDFSISGSTSGQSYATFYAIPEYGGTGVQLSAGYYSSYQDPLSASQPSILTLNGDIAEVSPGTYHGVITVMPNFVPAYSGFIIAESLFAESGVADLQANLSFDLPAGVTYSSDSGLLLTSAAVPEPGAWALMLLGVSAVGFAARRRRVAFA